jgi:hypothetical protein
MSKKSVADHSMEWRLLLDSIEADSQEAAFLKELLFELRHVRDTILQLDNERLALIARKQQITKDMNALKTRARSVAARIRSGIRTQHGYDSETLTKHGMKPRRRRTRDRLNEAEVLDRLAEEPS